jgi:hypothetical protein
MAITRALLMERAKANAVAVIAAKKVYDDHELVFAVWSDDDEIDSCGILVLKGRSWLNATALNKKNTPKGAVLLPKRRLLRWSAILCESAASAAALHHELGDSPSTL